MGARTYIKGGTGSRSSDMGRHASKLDECYKYIKKADLLNSEVPTNHLEVIRRAHLRLRELTSMQRGFFATGFRLWKWEMPKIKTLKAQGYSEEEAGGKAMGFVTGKILDEELTDLEKLVDEVLGILLEKIDENPHAYARVDAQKKLIRVRKRIMGMIAKVLPGALREALVHPGILPIFRECLYQNAHSVIRTEKGSGKAALAKLFVNEKGKVKGFVEPMIRESVAVAYHKIMERCQKWQAEAQQVNSNRHYSKSEYRNTSTHDGTYGLRNKNAKNAEDEIENNRLITQQELATLQRDFEHQILVLHCIVAVLVVLLIMSWLYIALSVFYFKRPGAPEPRRETVDLERGDGGRV